MAVESLDGFLSSMIAAASFDSDSGELLVQMVSGKEYTAPITADDWKEFQAASSKGSWYRTRIMGLSR